MRNLSVTALINDKGKLDAQNSIRISSFLKKNSDYVVTINFRVDKNRTNPQNKYYWGVVVPYITLALKEFGNETNNNLTHEFLKSEFNKKDICILDEVKTIVGSTADLTTTEFIEYIEKCCRFASEYLNISIPPPPEK